MIKVSSTQDFDTWLRKLPSQHRASVLQRIDRLQAGNPGDHHSIANAVSELRWRTFGGLRVYYTMMAVDVILLCGGNKKTQTKDIAKAIALRSELR